MADETVVIVQTDAVCTKPLLARLVDKYITDTLLPSEKPAFDQHCAECVACGTAVLNYLALKKGFQKVADEH